MFSKATKLVHVWVREHVRTGDLVVDATCGNGHDTVLLADCVGPGGKVVGMDVQEVAIRNTEEALASSGFSSRTRLYCMSHGQVADVLPSGRLIRCALFNLGYLPGGDKNIVTQPSSTVAAHQALLGHLEEGGVIVTTVYTGHGGGSEEADSLVAWSRGLDGKRYSVARHEWLNQDGHPPFILTIQLRERRITRT